MVKGHSHFLLPPSPADSISGTARGNGPGQHLSIIHNIQKIVSEILLITLRFGGKDGMNFGDVSAGQINVLIRVLTSRNDLKVLEVSLSQQTDRPNRLICFPSASSNHYGTPAQAGTGQPGPP